MSVYEYILWGSVALVAYAYFGYPVAVALLSRAVGRRTAKGPSLPSVTVIVAGYNEEAVIGKRLQNLIDSDYPKDRLEVIFGSDGSTDSTVAEASAFERCGVRVLVFNERRGKVSVLNDCVKAAKGEILVFTDARQTFDRGAIRALVENFADASVGAASGELMLSGASGFGSSFAAYWDYEKAVRRAESGIDSVIGVTGAIWALRKGLFEPYPADIILDDLYQPLRVVLKGYRVVFEPGARAFDVAEKAAGGEIRRKARTIAGNWQVFATMKGVLNPVRNRAFVQLVSHKLLRVLVPFLLAAAFGANLALAGSQFYRVLLLAQAAFYGLCLLSVAAPPRAAARVLKLFSAFTILNFSAIVGFVRYFTNSQGVIWKR